MSRHVYSAKELADDTNNEVDHLEEAFQEPNFFERAKQAAKENVEYLLLYRRMQMMEKIFAFILSRKSFNVLVDGILQILMETVDASAGSVFELDHNKNEFFFRAIRGEAADRVKDFRIPKDSGVVGDVAATKMPKLLNNIQREEKHIHSVGVVGGFEAKHCIAVPLIVGGQTMGVVEIFNKKGDELFTQDDFELIKYGTWMAAKIIEVRFLMAELIK